jgi:hypothetical protein
MARDLNIAIVALRFFFTLCAQEAPKVEAPIRLHTQNLHFSLRRNRAVVMIGSGEHYGAVLNGDFDSHQYSQTPETGGLDYPRFVRWSLCRTALDARGNPVLLAATGEFTGTISGVACDDRQDRTLRVSRACRRDPECLSFSPTGPDCDKCSAYARNYGA